MKAALLQARIAFEKDEVPIGAVIVYDEKIIACGYNQNFTLRDPTAHAEIIAIRDAARFINSSRLDNCDIYITLEPCAMCAMAISLARIRKIYYAASDSKFGAVENGVHVFHSASCHHKPEIYSGISGKESAELLQNFFQKKRNQKISRETI